MENKPEEIKEITVEEGLEESPKILNKASISKENIPPPMSEGKNSLKRISRTPEQSKSKSAFKPNQDSKTKEEVPSLAEKIMEKINSSCKKVVESLLPSKENASKHSHINSEVLL